MTSISHLFNDSPDWKGKKLFFFLIMTLDYETGNCIMSGKQRMLDMGSFFFYHLYFLSPM